MLNYFSQAYFFSFLLLRFLKIPLLQCEMSSLIQPLVQLSRMEILVPTRSWETQMRGLGRMWSFQHSLCSLFLFSVSWLASFYRIVLGAWVLFLLSVPHLFSGFLHLISLSVFLPLTVFHESELQRAWWWCDETWEKMCLGVSLCSWVKLQVKLRWWESEMCKTCYRNCAWCVWNSGSTHCTKAGQSTGLKLSSHS